MIWLCSAEQPKWPLKGHPWVSELMGRSPVTYFGAFGLGFLSGNEGKGKDIISPLAKCFQPHVPPLSAESGLDPGK